MIKLSYPKFWHKKMSPVGNILSYMLLPFAFIFAILDISRGAIATKRKLGKKVICVGNCTVGGTGKTQIIKHIAKILQQNSASYVIVTKAYGGSIKEACVVDDIHSAGMVGDESIELRQYGTIIAAPKIIDAIELIEKVNPDIVLVDDGMQNPNFHKDFTILVIDAERGIGNGRIVPAGPIRQTLQSAVVSADIAVLVGDRNLVDSKIVTLINEAKLELFFAGFKIKNKLDRDKKYLAFAGIGNPDRFFHMLEKDGIYLQNKIPFPDHHKYNDADLKNIYDIAKHNCLNIVTTAKDASKLENIEMRADWSYEIVNVELNFASESKSFANRIKEKVIEKN